METDKNLSTTLKRMEMKQNIIIGIGIVTLLLLIGIGIYGFWVYSTYKGQIQDAFDTINKIDDIVNSLKGSYSSYDAEIKDMFETLDQVKSLVDQVQTAVDTIKSTLSALPFINFG